MIQMFEHRCETKKSSFLFKNMTHVTLTVNAATETIRSSHALLIINNSKYRLFIQLE